MISLANDLLPGLVLDPVILVQLIIPLGPKHSCVCLPTSFVLLAGLYCFFPFAALCLICLAPLPIALRFNPRTWSDKERLVNSDFMLNRFSTTFWFFALTSGLVSLNHFANIRTCFLRLKVYSVWSSW